MRQEEKFNLNRALKDKVVQMRKLGQSYKHIGMKFNVSAYTIHLACKKWGID